jgi:hypothetical protein
VEFFLRGFLFLTGVFLVVGTAFSALETFVLPRPVSVGDPPGIFGNTLIHHIPLKGRTYGGDRIMAFTPHWANGACAVWHSL